MQISLAESYCVSKCCSAAIFQVLYLSLLENTKEEAMDGIEVKIIFHD